MTNQAIAEKQKKPTLASWSLKVCPEHPTLRLARGGRFCFECGHDVEGEWVKVAPVKEAHIWAKLQELQRLLPDCKECRRRLIFGVDKTDD